MLKLIEFLVRKMGIEVEREMAEKAKEKKGKIL
jgi:hypothetical protein